VLVEHGGVALAGGVLVIEIEFGQYVFDRGFVGAFDFDIGSEQGYLVEADGAIFQQPFAASFFKGEHDLIAQGQEELAGELAITGFEFDFLSFFIRGVRGDGAFEAQEVFNGVLIFFLAEAEPAIGLSQVMVRFVEEEIALEDLPAGMGAEQLQLIGEFIQGVNFDFGFDFRRHDVFPVLYIFLAIVIIQPMNSIVHSKIMNRQYILQLFLLISIWFGIGSAVLNGMVVPETAYTIDPIRGSDAYPGTHSKPWKSFRNIISYYKAEYRPAGWVELKPGDTVYLMGGTYQEILHPGDGKTGRSGGGSAIAYFRGKRGEEAKKFHLQAYGGEQPILDPQNQGKGMDLLSSSWWEIEGIEIQNAYGRGIRIGDSNHIQVHNVKVHDTDGVDNNNIAGLEILNSREVEISHSTFHDNYDRTCADTNGKATENSCNLVIFGGTQGGDITVRDCTFYQSKPVTHKVSGGGLKYKHAARDPKAYFNVYNNTFINHKFFAFGSGTANTHFHHNLILGGGSIVSRDFGGVTHQVNQIFEYNTICNARGLTLHPTIRWRNEKFPDDPKRIIFRNNIVYDTTESYHQERATVTIGTYMSDELYHLTVPQLHFQNNCYFNPIQPVQFNLGAGFQSREGFTAGGKYSFPQWQAKFGYDKNSLEQDPLFVDPAKRKLRLRSESPCKHMGQFAGY
jgi:parallel beta helix pectate lyase-like protein